MPAAAFLASSYVIRLAAARRPGSLSKQDIGHGKRVGVADNVGNRDIAGLSKARGKLVIHRPKAINHGYNILFLLEYLFIYPQNIIN
jgi:hypothetical protein